MLPWFPRDYLASTRALTLAERGALTDLLWFAWDLNAPLPNDPDRLARMIGSPAEEFAILWPAIRGRFVETPNGLVNERLELERRKSEAMKEKARARGKLGAEKRWSSSRSSASDNAATIARTLPETWLKDASSIDRPLPEHWPPSPSPSPTTSLSLPRARDGDEGWQATPGLNVEAFGRYLDHVLALVDAGEVRRAPLDLSQKAQAEWLAAQGDSERQQLILNNAIRHGWVRLGPLDRRGNPL